MAKFLQRIQSTFIPVGRQTLGLACSIHNKCLDQYNVLNQCKHVKELHMYAINSHNFQIGTMSNKQKHKNKLCVEKNNVKIYKRRFNSACFQNLNVKAWYGPKIVYHTEHLYPHNWNFKCCTEVKTYATKAQLSLSLKNQVYKDYLESLEEEYNSLKEKSNSPQFKHSDNLQSQRLRPVVETFQSARQKYEDLEELRLMAKDEELKDIVETEMTEVLSAIEEIEEQLVSILNPPEKVDDCDIILEVECGAGGQESMFFAVEIFKMYANLSTRLGWQFETIETTPGEKGGYNSASASISGHGVYHSMKYEGGVHRVQRVPATEAKGRMHTSTVTVAILPQPKEIDIEVSKKDLKIESMRSSGPGGQHVNKVNTAVRIVHIPTGYVIECQESRSYVQNEKLALTKLKSRLYEQQLKQQTSNTVSQRKIQVGNKDRSEKIRTYNFTQDRITDHRIGYSASHITSFMMGSSGLTDMMNKLQEGAKYEAIENKVEEFERSRLDVKLKLGKKK